MANKTRVYGSEIIQEIINRYIQEYDITGHIEYSKVRDFTTKLWKENDPIIAEKMYYQLIDSNTGETSEKIYKNICLSDDFWRKPQYQGRKKIDETNDFLSKTVAKTRKRQVFVPNVDFVLETHKNNLSQLRLHLKPLEAQIISSIANETKLEEKIQKLEEQIQNLKHEKNSLKQNNDNLQTALYKLFEYSASKDILLPSMSNTGDERSRRVEKALKEAFSGDPSDFYLRFEDDNEENEQISSNNVASLEDFKTNKLSKGYSEDYDFD